MILQLGQLLHQAKMLQNICKILLASCDQMLVASFPNWKPCCQLPFADPRWSEPAPGSGLRGHPHKTAGNSLSSARITAHQDQTLVYLMCFNKATVDQVLLYWVKNGKLTFRFLFNTIESGKHVMCAWKMKYNLSYRQSKSGSTVVLTTI